MKIKVADTAVFDARYAVDQLPMAKTLADTADAWEKNRHKLRAEHRERAIADWAAISDALNSPANEALRKVNGTATAHTITSWMDLFTLARDAENDLRARGVTKKGMAGVTLDYHPAGPTANAYKYEAISTMITLKRTGGGWWLTSVVRVGLPPKRAELRRMTVSDMAREDIPRHALAGIA